MHFAIATRTYWNDIFLIPAQLMEELKFWRYNITAFSGYSIRPKYSFDYVIYTDASSCGFGGYIDKSILHLSGACGFIKSKPEVLHFKN